ncbi:hypothetical protein F53441_12574 [Fusarium austroafricanum]|uniref:Proteasome component ECM29 n=1 Tax=Fusarium austroafricanum TaxID=2364996 RepID=A0A8H4JX96_9HYPO|nr:hypothetical protein F53441_12574 [Fusarium austroafricanum]
MAASTQKRELQLLDSVEFKILNVANKEKKLHELLQRYLPPVILKAASEHAPVRAKASSEMTLNCNTFIQPPEVILPVGALIDQYKSSDSPLVKQLDISGIQHSIERLDDYERKELIPKALSGFAKDEGQARAGPFFNIILRLLLDAKIPPRGSKDDTEYRKALGLSEADAKFLANMISIFLRLRNPTQTHNWTTANPTLTRSELDSLAVESPESQKVLQRMSELKLKLVALLASGAFTDEEKFLPALYAASSFDNRLVSAAEEVLKRSSVSMEDEALVKRLFHAHSILPPTYRTRILGMLSKSTISATMSDDIMAVVRLNFSNPRLDSTPNDPSLSLLPKSALEQTKLHTATFQYLAWVARVGPSQEGFDIAVPLIDTMSGFVKDNGWPVPERTSHDDIALRSKAYETIGVLARSANMPIERRLELAGWLFKSLSEDPTTDAVVNIDGALSSLTNNIPVSTGSEADRLKNMLLTYMTLPDEPPAVRSTRHAVVKWANQCLTFSDVMGRWIDILAIGAHQDERSDVIEQGHKGLDPWTYHAHAEASPVLPDWKEMIVAFFGAEITAGSHNEATALPDFTEKAHSVFENFQGSRIAAFPIALRYCKHMMFLTALKDFEVEPDWMQTLDARVKTDIKTREKILAYLHTIDSGFIVFYLKACLEGAYLKDSPIKEECIRCFVDVASLSPGGALGYLAKFNDGLFQLIKSNNKEIRSLTARALGILVSHLANDPTVIDNCCQALSALFENAEKLVGSELNAAEGGLLAYSYVCSRSVYYGQPIPDNVRYPMHLLTGENVASSLHDTALEAFAQLWTAGLSIPQRDGDLSLETVVSKLVAPAKKGNEKAILALGRLAAGLSESEEAKSEDGWSHGILGKILKELFALHEIKQVEVQFTVGDAITATLARWESDYVKLTLDVESRGCLQKRNGARSSLLTAVLNKIFADCKATKPSLLKASGIWLFCIVQYCSHLNEVQSRLRETQAAFMRLLSARDELVQETASRGLSLVYERGDADLKSALVKDLVSAFTGNGTQLKVDQETELFEPGALPTGEGSSITSYKDIVNLANEVGDQRLVYKFMSLAANAATWSTRSAFGRFGLSNILSESEVDPKLYPKLYRYRFDPNQNVQRSMDDIWKALVKDSGAVLSTHFDAILEDLLKSILGREWRMREASCAAISELIQGQPFNKYEQRYRDIWTSALKVLDDVKGSVREAAFKLCRTLSNTLVRQLEEGTSGSAARSMMKEALPFLLSDKGIESSVKEVQAFSAITVIELTKKGGKALRPFIPDMVPQLLGLLSSIEPEAINWHYQRAGEDSRDQIDKIRSQMVNRSPISEAIDNSLRFVDADVMAELAPKLEATIKTAIGMPTKIGCSRVLTTLFTHHTNEIKGVGNKFLQLMEKQTMDKNDEVSQAYARATAYMLRSASDSAKLRFCKKFIAIYFESEEETRRQKTADVIVALAKVSPDHFTGLESMLLPFSYLGSHDTDEYTSKAFKEVWEQHAGSSRTVVRYVPEIVALVTSCLDTAQWALRHGGAFTMAAMVSDITSASDVSGQISEANLRKVWPVFEKTLALKTFDGKEKLLESYPKFVEKGHSLWKSDSKIAAQMKKIALREAKRNNDEYRVHAFRCLWKFAKARDDLDMLDEIAEIVTPYLDELKGEDENEDKMDIDSKDQVKKEQLAEKTASNGLEAVARGHSHTDLAVLTKILNLLKPFLSSPNFSTIKRQVWYECVRDLMTDAKASSTPDENAVALTYLLSLDVDLVDTGTESQRVMRAKAVGALFKAKGRGVFGPSGGPDAAQLKTMVSQALEAERSLEVQRVLRDILVEME